MTWGKSKTQGKGKLNVNRNKKSYVQKKTLKKKQNQDGCGTRNQLELGDKKESLETIGCLFMDTA